QLDHTPRVEVRVEVRVYGKVAYPGRRVSLDKVHDIGSGTDGVLAVSRVHFPCDGAVYRWWKCNASIIQALEFSDDLTLSQVPSEGTCMRIGSGRGRGVLTGQVNACRLHASSDIHGTVDAGLDVVQWAGDGEEFTLVGRRGQHDRTTRVGKELVQGIFPIAKDELMLATVDCQMTK